MGGGGHVGGGHIGGGIGGGHIGGGGAVHVGGVLILEGILHPLFMAQWSKSLLCVLPRVIFTTGIMVRGIIPIAHRVVFVIRGVVVATTTHHITTAGVVGVTGVGAAMAGGADATTPTDGDAILTMDGAIGHMMLLLALSSWRRQ